MAEKKEFKFGDLVWAKMKGYPPWPGKIMAPPADVKVKKKFQYVFFFGSDNYAVVPENFINLHSEEMVNLYKERKNPAFQAALQKIIDYAAKGESSDESMERSESPSSENAFSAASMEEDFGAASEGSSKIKSPQSLSVRPKIKKKQSLEKVQPVKIHSPEKKPVRKQIYSTESKPQSGSSSEDDSNEPGGSMRPESPPADPSEFMREKIVRKRIHSPRENKPESVSSQKVEADEPGGSSSVRFELSDLFSSLDPEKSYEASQSASSPSISPMDSENIYEASQSAPSLSISPQRKYYERPNSPPIDLTYQSGFIKERKIKPTKKKIGFLGLSKMGQAMVRNLYHSGHSLIIWDQNQGIYDIFTEKFKLQIAETPCDVVKAADITFSCMPDSDAAMELVSEKYGILKEIESSTAVNKGYVELSPLDPKLSQFIGTEIRLRGGRYIEAPVLEARKDAHQGTLYIKIAGDETLYDDCKSVFDTIAKKHTFVSADVGMSTKYAAVENMLTGTVYAALAESMALAKAVGIDSKHFLNIFEVSDMNCPALLDKLTAMDQNDYTTDTSLKAMKEQINFGLTLGDEVLQRTSIFAAAREMYKRCDAMQYGDHDVSALYEGSK